MWRSEEQVLPSTSDFVRAQLAEGSESTQRRKQRRTRIPNRPANSINYLSLMRSCIGRDLTRTAMPVDFNEPLSALQKATEELEYAHVLLSSAAHEADPYKRLALVAVFAISGYSTSAARTTKPFNPLLGETFECNRLDDFGWRSLAEQVSHHPPMYALHAESADWSLSQFYSVETKIKERCLCVFPLGSTYLRFARTGDVFVYGKVRSSTSLTNVISGKIQTELYGDLVIANVSRGDRCVLKFHENNSSFFSKTNFQRKVSGCVTSSCGREHYKIDATWNQCALITRATTPSNGTMARFAENGELVWMANELPKNSAKMHNFTRFAMELNEPELNVAPTDSRRRPDQRCMEEGDWPMANALKLKLEAAQRQRRKNVEEKGAHRYQPMWFREKQADEMIDKNDVYAFDGDYWRCKTSQQWSAAACPNIFTVD